jgi:hypothetical protein
VRVGIIKALRNVGGATGVVKFGLEDMYRAAMEDNGVRGCIREKRAPFPGLCQALDASEMLPRIAGGWAARGVESA